MIVISLNYIILLKSITATIIVHDLVCQPLKCHLFLIFGRTVGLSQSVDRLAFYASTDLRHRC